VRATTEQTIIKIGTTATIARHVGAYRGVAATAGDAPLASGRWKGLFGADELFRIGDVRSRDLIGPQAAFLHARLLPRLVGGLDRVDAGGLPPCPLVAALTPGLADLRW
jgi:hypothetical protein